MRSFQNSRNASGYEIAYAIALFLMLAGIAVAWLYAVEPFRSITMVLLAVLVGTLSLLLAMRLGDDSRNVPAASAASNILPHTLSWNDVVAAIADPAIVIDQPLVVLEFNQPAQALFERLRKGLPLEHVNRDPELLDAVASAFTTGERRTARLVRRGGFERRLRANVTPLGKSDGQAQALLVTFQDQSEQHRLLEMRSDFIANASHELRTPLASVRGFIETLQGPAKNDASARDRFLSIMAGQAERMTRLIDDLLLLDRKSVV